MVLNLNIIIFAKGLLVPISYFKCFLVIVLEEMLTKLSTKTAGKDNQAFSLVSKHLLIYARFVVEALKVSTRIETD